MGLFKKKKTSGEEMQSSTEAAQSSSSKSETALLMLVERRIPDMVNYFGQFGIAVEQVYTDIEEAKIGMLIQSGRARMVIVDSGLAHFTTTAMRAEVKDLLGLCDGEDKFGTVFYTDTLLKSDNTKGRKGANSVDWQPYTGTQGVISRLKSYKEDYVSSGSGNSGEQLPSPQETLSFKGEYVEPVYSGIKIHNISTERVDKALQLIKQMDGAEEESLRRFDVKY